MLGCLAHPRLPSYILMWAAKSPGRSSVGKKFAIVCGRRPVWSRAGVPPLGTQALAMMLVTMALGKVVAHSFRGTNRRTPLFRPRLGAPAVALAGRWGFVTRSMLFAEHVAFYGKIYALHIGAQTRLRA